MRERELINSVCSPNDADSSDINMFISTYTSSLLPSLFLPSVERKGAFLSKEPGCGDFAPFLELGRRLSNCSLALFFIWNFANAPLHCLSPRRVWKFAPGARPVSRPLPLPLRPFSRPRRLGSAQGCCRAWGNAVEQRPLDRKLKKKSSGEACSSEKSVVVRRRLARASKKNGFFSFFDLGRRGREHSSRRRPHSLFSLFFFLSPLTLRPPSQLLSPSPLKHEKNESEI